MTVSTKLSTTPLPWSSAALPTVTHRLDICSVLENSYINTNRIIHLTPVILTEKNRDDNNISSSIITTTTRTTTSSEKEDSFSVFKFLLSITALCTLLLLGFSTTVILLITMISAVECTKIASLNTDKHDKVRGHEFAPNYYISGEVDGKIEQWGPGDWMRPLGDVEVMFAIGGFFKSLNTVQAVWLDTDKPLTRFMVRQALEQLVQRIPVLNICIQRRGIKLWYRRVEKTVIDFDVQYGDTMKVFNQVQAGTYDLEKGPLWRARMATLPPDEASPRGVLAKHHSMIVFGVQHSITDATTNIIICKELVSILNDMLQCRPISSLPYPLTAPHAEKQVDTTKSYLCKYFFKRFFNVLVLDFNKKTTFRGLLPLPKHYVVETRVLKHVFDEDVTKKLLSRCKENNTTVHSCIVTAANAAYLDIAGQNTKHMLNEVGMYYLDCINLRRYYPQAEREHIGCHITLHEQKTVMSIDGKVNFWNTARNSKAALHEDLAGKDCLKIIPIVKWVSILFPLNIYRNRKGSCNVTDSHYITTNMGDITKVMGETDPEDPVRVSDIFRSATGEQAGHLFTLTCNTFRKRFYLSIDYYGNKMADSQANDFFNDMKSKLIKLAETGNIC